MFVIQVRGLLFGKIIVEACSSDANDVPRAERYLTAIDSAIRKVQRADGKREAKADPQHKARRRGFKRVMAGKSAKRSA
jgi:hypothetical protein